jgi:hypothetical protein
MRSGLPGHERPVGDPDHAMQVILVKQFASLKKEKKTGSVAAAKVVFARIIRVDISSGKENS